MAIFVGKRREEPGRYDRGKEARKRQVSRHSKYLEGNFKRYVKL